MCKRDKEIKLSIYTDKLSHKMKWMRHVSGVREIRNTYKYFGRKT
jgi:hypothetical protein